MAKILKILLIIAPLINTILSETNEHCEQKSSCLCEFSEYSRIDLTNITETSDEKYFIEDERNDITYYFHGCTDGLFNVSAHGVINDTSIYKSTLLSKYFDKGANNTKVTILGNSSQIHFNRVDDKSYELIFKNGSNVTANIQLVCSYSLPAQFVVVDGAKNQFALISSHACILTQHPGMSTGSVLIILLIISVTIYLVCGGLLMYFVRGARGIELIPNIDFWRQLPGLVKDGIIFLFSGCNANSITTPETYDRI